MRIKIIPEEHLLDLKGNHKINYRKYGTNVNPMIKGYFDEKPYINTKYEIDDFDLVVSNDKPNLTDFANVQIVYSKLEFLSNSEASDERLWAWFCLDPFYKYVQFRWRIDGSHNANAVLNHFFFSNSIRRSFTRNAIARLWWIGRLTYDISREDPFEITEFVCRNSDNIQHILERNISNNIDLIKPFIKAIFDSEKEGINVNTDDIASLMKYYNLLGGTYVLDSQSPEWIYKKIMNRINKIKKTSINYEN